MELIQGEASPFFSIKVRVRRGSSFLVWTLKLDNKDKAK